MRKSRDNSLPRPTVVESPVNHACLDTKVAGPFLHCLSFVPLVIGAVLLYGPLDAFLERPTKDCEASIETTYGDALLAGPLRQSHRLSIVSQEAIAPCVVGLLYSGRPAAVVRRIWAVVVDPLNAEPRPIRDVHVIVEGLEVLPSITYDDTPSSIVGVSCRAWVVASPTEPLPDQIQSRICHSMDFPVFTNLREFLAAYAATAYGVARSQTICPGNRMSATRALASPVTTAILNDVLGGSKFAKHIALSNYGHINLLFGEATDHATSCQENFEAT